MVKSHDETEKYILFRIGVIACVVREEKHSGELEPPFHKVDQLYRRIQFD